MQPFTIKDVKNNDNNICSRQHYIISWPFRLTPWCLQGTTPSWHCVAMVDLNIYLTLLTVIHTYSFDYPFFQVLFCLYKITQCFIWSHYEEYMGPVQWKLRMSRFCELMVCIRLSEKNASSQSWKIFLKAGELTFGNTCFLKDKTIYNITALWCPSLLFKTFMSVLQLRSLHLRALMSNKNIPPQHVKCCLFSFKKEQHITIRLRNIEKQEVLT